MVTHNPELTITPVASSLCWTENSTLTSIKRKRKFTVPIVDDEKEENLRSKIFKEIKGEKM